MKANQLMLPVGGEVGTAINQVFATKEIKNTKGDVVGTSVVLQSRKIVQDTLDLKGKNNRTALDTAILERQDMAFRHVKSEIAGLNGDWTLHKVANRTLGDGVRQITVVVREVSRKKGPTDEAIAEAIGKTVEEVREMRARQLKALEATTVESTVTAAE